MSSGCQTHEYGNKQPDVTRPLSEAWVQLERDGIFRHFVDDPVARSMMFPASSCAQADTAGIVIRTTVTAVSRTSFSTPKQTRIFTHLGDDVEHKP